MGPMTLWKHQNRSGDLLGPNCLRGPLFSFAVKPLYTDTRCVTALHSYTALYSAIHYTAIQLYSAIHYTTSTTPLWVFNKLLRFFLFYHALPDRRYTVWAPHTHTKCYLMTPRVPFPQCAPSWHRRLILASARSLVPVPPMVFALDLASLSLLSRSRLWIARAEASCRLARTFCAAGHTSTAATQRTPCGLNEGTRLG